MWKYGCNSWDWRKYGSEFSPIWPSAPTGWTWHHTQNSWLFLVIFVNLPWIGYSYFMLCLCRCALEKEQFLCFNWEREWRLLLSFIIILLFGIKLQLHSCKFPESNAVELFGRFWFCILEIEGKINRFFVFILRQQTLCWGLSLPSLTHILSNQSGITWPSCGLELKKKNGFNLKKNGILGLNMFLLVNFFFFVYFDSAFWFLNSTLTDLFIYIYVLRAAYSFAPTGKILSYLSSVGNKCLKWNFQIDCLQ